MKKKKVKDKEKPPFKSFRSSDKSHYRTVKTTLKSVLKDIEIIPQIENLVQEMNDLVIHVYQFIRLYILFLWEKKSDFPDINDYWIKSCIRTLGIRNPRGAKSKDQQLLKILNDFYTQEYKPLLDHQKTDLRNKAHLQSYIATKILTGITVNIKEHFVQHLRRFINITTQDITRDESVLHKFKKQFLEIENTDKIFDTWMNKHESNILPDNIQKSVNYDVKVRPFEYLKGMLYMNSVLEKQGDSKLFQPLPLRSNIVPKNLLIDSASLVDLLCPENHKKGDLLNKITMNQELIWSSLLRTNSKVFKDKHYVFDNQIQTDGISCSLLFIRKDLANKKWGTNTEKVPEQEFYNIEDLTKEQLDTLKNRNVVGCDPGKRSLVYMVDKDGKKLQYTSPQRMRESKSKRNKQILLREKKKNGITVLETKLATSNSKTVDYDKFKTYLVEKDKLNKETKTFYQQKKWRKMNFRTYSYGQKSIDKFLNRIEKIYGSPEEVIIGYGNWSRSTQMKNYESTINKGLRKLIHKKYDTLTINEHNTSKKCCGCHGDLVHHKDTKGKEIFRLLKCSKCVSAAHKQIVFRTRDVNSAVNIREITSLWIHEQRRLPVFSRNEESSFTIKVSIEKGGPSKEA